MPTAPFPKNFLWGCAAASYQIEGAVDEDGRGPSIWDDLCARPGAILNGDSGRVACDHYHRWEEDLDLMKELGFGAYRFSVAWPRILPNGTGEVNEAGLAFYDRLVDGLLKRGIQPMLTLYHWDLPSALQKKGGWQKRDTPLAMGDYAEIVARRLGDRVRMWTSINEMPCVIDAGHRHGDHAPGLRLKEKGVRQVAHHVLLGHGLAIQGIRAGCSKPPKVSIVHNPWVAVPFAEEKAHVDAGRHDFVENNDWLMDPLFKGSYPKKKLEALGKDAPKIERGDMRNICQPLDYVGLNIYAAHLMSHAHQGLIAYPKHHPRTHMDWPVTPDVLYWALRFTHEAYAPGDLYITENGCAWPDQVDGDGRVQDLSRVQFFQEYLRGVQRACAEKLPVRGYFVWSILDNFEWAWGYSRRFGIVHVNYETLKRTPKASAWWLKSVIEANAV